MQRSTIKAVESVILDSYVEHLQPITVMEIRAACKLSETIIRRAVTESPRVTRTHKEVPIMSKASPGRVHQSRTIVAFYPTREWLVEVIKQGRREFDYYRYEKSWR